MTCIRRPNALWTTCRCAKCEPHHRRLLKLHHAGMLNRPRPEQAVSLIKTWRAEGYSILWIATAAGVDKSWVLTVAKGIVTTPGPILTSRILKADISKATAGFCSSLGARRRLQALAVMGWDLYTLSDRYDVPPAVLSRIRNGTAKEVHAARYASICAAYRELSGTRGPSKQGASRALNLGWAPPAAWDDPDAPDETYDPKARTTNRNRPIGELVEEVEWLLGAEPLATAAQIARRLGYADKSTIQHALDRNGHHALLARLARNAEVAA